MRTLLATIAAATMLIALPAAAQERPSDSYRGVAAGFDGRDASGNLTREGRADRERDWSRAKRAVVRERENKAAAAPADYRLFDWDRPDPARGGAYFADDYFHAWPHAVRLKPGQRVYRGRDGLYYCRHPDGGTGLIRKAVAEQLLADALPIGGSALLRDLPGADLALALRLKRVICN